MVEKCLEHNYRTSKEEVLGSPLGFQRRGKVKFTDVIKSNYSFLLQKHPAPFHLGNLGFTVYFSVTFPIHRSKPLPAVQHFTSPSARGYVRNLCIINAYLQLWHFRSQFMCQCARDTVNLITCVSTKPFSWAGLPEPQLCFHLPYNL